MIAVLIMKHLLRPTRHKSKLGESRGRNASASGRVAHESAVAPTGRAACRAGVRREITLSTRPDTSRGPVIGDGEGGSRTRSHLPPSCLRGNRATGLREEARPGDMLAPGRCQGEEQGLPDSIGALVVDGEGAVS